MGALGHAMYETWKNYLPIPPDPEMEAGLENRGHRSAAPPKWFPPDLMCTREKEANNLEMVKC